MTTTQKLIQPKLGLLKLAEKLGNVSDACKVMPGGRWSKSINELFDKSDKFKLPGEAETSSAGEQLVRNIQVDGNEKGAENLPAPSQFHFLSNT